MASRRWKVMLTILGIFWLGLSAVATAGEPTEMVRQVTDQVLKVLEDPQLQGAEKQSEREQRLHQIAGQAFDWEEMARRALATYWRERTAPERQEFVGLFRDLVERTYMNRLEQASKEKQDIQYTKEQVEGSRAVVGTKAITTRGAEVPIEYRLHKADNRWLVYDVLIEGVSLVNNYRSQFHQIITSSSYNNLIQKMRSREVSATPPKGRTP